MRRKRADALSPPPVNESERERARNEVGIFALEVLSWHATEGNCGSSGGHGGEVRIGSEEEFGEAERVAARRTAERN